MAATVRKVFPNAAVLFLGTRYTKAVLESCSNIDEYVEFEEAAADPSLLAAKKIDVLLNPGLDVRLGMAAKAAGIPIRIGNLRRPGSVRWANRFIYQGSRNVPLHAANMNLRYLRPLGIRVEYPLDQLAHLLCLRNLSPLGDELASRIDPSRFNLVVHPKSNKNGREWPAAYFNRLLDLLPKDRFRILLTGRAEERAEVLGECPGLLERSDVVDLMGRLELRQFLSLLKSVDGFIGSGTGPLHIAAAFGKRVLGLFPPRDRINTQRWQPLGLQAETISLPTRCEPGPGRCPRFHSGGPCPCMTGIDPANVAQRLRAWIA